MAWTAEAHRALRPPLFDIFTGLNRVCYTTLHGSERGTSSAIDRYTSRPTLKPAKRRRANSSTRRSRRSWTPDGSRAVEKQSSGRSKLATTTCVDSGKKNKYNSFPRQTVRPSFSPSSKLLFCVGCEWRLCRTSCSSPCSPSFPPTTYQFHASTLLHCFLFFFH
jgi:hypothetical protein